MSRAWRGKRASDKWAKGVSLPCPFVKSHRINGLGKDVIKCDTPYRYIRVCPFHNGPLLTLGQFSIIFKIGPFMNLWLAILTFVFAITFDWLAALGLYAIWQKQILKSTIYAVLLEALACFFIKIISYEGLYALPSILGAGIGTAAAVYQAKHGHFEMSEES